LRTAPGRPGDGSHDARRWPGYRSPWPDNPHTRDGRPGGPCAGAATPGHRDDAWPCLPAAWVRNAAVRLLRVSRSSRAAPAQDNQGRRKGDEASQSPSAGLRYWKASISPALITCVFTSASTWLQAAASALTGSTSCPRARDALHLRPWPPLLPRLLPPRRRPPFGGWQLGQTLPR
jgi:hypothetical protein